MRMSTRMNVTMCKKQTKKKLLTKKVVPRLNVLLEFCCSVLFCSVLGDQDSFQSPNLKLATTSVVVVLLRNRETHNPSWLVWCGVAQHIASSSSTTKTTTAHHHHHHQMCSVNMRFFTCWQVFEFALKRNPCKSTFQSLKRIMKQTCLKMIFVRQISYWKLS